MSEIKGVIKNYRQGVRTQYTNQIIVNIENYDKEKSKKLVGKKAIWLTSSGKKIIGKVASVHGNKGAVRIRFDKGLPGQAIGTEITILS